MEKHRKLQFIETLKSSKRKLTLFFNTVAHTLISTLKSIGRQKAGPNDSVHTTMTTYFRIFR